MTKLEKQARTFHEKHLEKHRQDKETTRKIDRMMAFIGVMGPLSTFVQVLHIFAVKTAAGISVYTWVGYMVVSTCWFAYGYFYKDRPLMLVNSLSFCVNSLIIVAFALYR